MQIPITLSRILCAVQWVSSVLKPARMMSVSRKISEKNCGVIPILYSLSPTYIDVENVGTIERGLLVSNCCLLAVDNF